MRSDSVTPLIFFLCEALLPRISKKQKNNTTKTPRNHPAKIRTTPAKTRKSRKQGFWLNSTHTSNVKWGLIIPPGLINHHCPPKKCNLKTGGPPRLIKPPIKKPPLRKSIFLSNIFYFQFYLFPIVFYLFLNQHCYTSGLSWSLKISKNNYSPNDRFLIKIFIKKHQFG